MGSSMVMKPRVQNPATSLRVWIPLVFVLFVALGTVGLLVVFEHRQQVEEREAFEELARVNAAFMERSRLPRTEQMAARLSEVIGAEVFFRDPRSGRILGPPDSAMPMEVLQVSQQGKVGRLSSGKLGVVVTDASGVQMVFLRSQQLHGLADLGAEAWFTIGFFWLLSMALGFGLSLRVSGPLQSLVKALPKVGTAESLPRLPVDRRDEIGSLARVLVETHRSLGEERERRRQAERLALLGRMATGIAHEIRNPAAAIRLHTELLDASDSTSLAKSRHLILEEAKRLENLVSQWMHYSRPEPPKTSEMDLAAMLREVAEVMTPQAKHMNVEIVLDLPDRERVLVVADRHRLHQVFTNLTLNAIQAMPKGGKVSIELRERSDHVEIRLSDEGRGFSELALQRGGEPFFSEREGGLGLGLAVATDICRAHGGSLELSNLKEGGACIRVELRKIPPHNAGTA